MKTYLVGGAVRDKLLGIIPKERDFVVVGSSPEEMGNKGFKPVGKDFPVFLHPETNEEYALARREKKDGHGYGGFQFFTSPEITLEEDLLRRDLTINAIAESEHGEVIDPYGGQRDLEQRVLRHVSDAFIEDPLRVLRVARFAARFVHFGFSIAPETLVLMKELVTSGELGHLSPERIWQELETALTEGSPATFIRELRNCNALVALLPEVDALFGVPQRADYHPEVDTGIHLLMSLDCATQLTNGKPDNEKSLIRFAVLMHDLGKAKTPQAILPRHIGHEAAGVPLVHAVCDRFKIPNRHRELAALVCEYHLLCHQAQELRPATLLKLLGNLDAYRRPERLSQFVSACEADARGRLGFEEKPYPSGQWLETVYQQTAQVSPQQFLDQGIKGKALGEAIHQERLGIIKQLANNKGAIRS